MQEFNSNNYVFFTLDKSKLNNAVFGFRAEYNDAQGDVKRITVNKIDKNTNEKMVKKYSIQKGLGSLRINKHQKEEIEFLRNHPNCAGSPNGSYRDDGKGGSVQLGVWFSELNTEKAAIDGLEAKKISMDAANAVMEVSNDAEKLMALASIFGYRGSFSVVLFKLIEHAQKHPSMVLEELESPTFKSKSLFRQGIDENLITKKGVMYVLEDFDIGIDEESCIKTIETNKDVSDLLIKKLKNS